MTKHLLPPICTRGLAETAELTRAELRDDGMRVTRGAYVSRAVPWTPATACAAALQVLREGAVVSHRTAAVLLGAPVPAGPPLSLAVPPGVGRPRRRDLRVHVRTLGADDCTVHRGLPLTSPAQTWLDLAGELPPEELVAVGDHLLRAGPLDAPALAARLVRADGVRGIRLARRCAPMLTATAASRPESIVRYWLWDSDLPDPVCQIPVRNASGQVVLHADLGWEQWKVALEYEGRQHAEREQFGRDLERYTLMASDGWLLLRFGERDLTRRPRLLSRVAGALRSHGASW